MVLFPMLTICHRHELGSDTMAVLRELADLARAILRKGDEILKTLADLQADVAAEQTVEQSAITLLTGLTAQIAALKTAGTDPATAAAIDALAIQVETNTAALSSAVTANTPAASTDTSAGTTAG